MTSLFALALVFFPDTVVVCNSSAATTYQPRAAVEVKVFPADSGLGYTWSGSQGAITGEGSAVRWDLSKAPLGIHALTVQVARGAKKIGECQVQVRVEQPLGSRGKGDLTARSLLVDSAAERAGYGLYSYLLFGARPDDRSRPVYTRVVAEFLRLLPEINQFTKELDAEQRKQVNVSYILLRRPLARQDKDTVAAILSKYNYERAKVLLSRLPGNHPAGPYLVSSRVPLTSKTPTSGGYLVHDLSRIDAGDVPTYVNSFLSQTAQERFGTQWNPQLWVLKLRTLFTAVGLGAQAVGKAMGEWKTTIPQ